ncbi:MAG: Asp-tRNA(Asn)/Glu-tRNA(Gln) amidotransferase subunit GatB [Calditrichaeota bacterium]|nr:Asp-tRNA(Asn)/Glu-tRNA(Gln) amidotransferase subunit GatB [Calditrichota bacterium]
MQSFDMKYEPVIGLEVHIQLLTESKIFCSCSTKFGAEQNTHVCPICLGLPGVLPVLNEKVIEYAIKLALATNSRINKRSIFARKNYFYPDLPKGYQISQFEEPFCEFGRILIKVDGEKSREISLTRIHLEEDAGKSVHAESFVSKDETLVDVNRCGTPLLEIVSEPDFRTPKEAAAYLTRLRQIVRYLGVCDGNMEEGSMRCDANISVRPQGQEKLGVKTELKNMNSISSVEKALDFEIDRQISVLSEGGSISQETLLWDANRNVAEPMRSKEYSDDYRYFPEPDLVPVEVDEEWVDRVSQSMPELPLAKKQRFVQEFALPEYDAQVLSEDRAIADYFETAAQKVADKKAVSNMVMGEVLRVIKEQQIRVEDLKITPEYLSEIINMIDEGAISRNIAKKVFNRVAETGTAPRVVVEQEGLLQISDTSALEATLDQVLQENPNEVQAFLNGKEKVVGFLMGQVMRATSGKANPKSVNALLRKKLSDLKS